MFSSPVLALHIVSGTAGVVTGAAALSLRKGSRWHSLTGSVFVVAMVGLALTGIEMAIVKSQPGNILGGSLTAYLVTTAWWTAHHREVRIGTFYWAAVAIGSAIAATALTLGIAAAMSPTGMVFFYGPGPYLLLGMVGLLASLGDLRLLVRRSLSASQRLGRHLWRMCFALFIGTSSIFLARPHLFPAFMRTTGALYVLTFFPLVLMIFWLIRVRFAKAYRNKIPSEAKHPLSIEA
jgi:uncharacterized membrane protein